MELQGTFNFRDVGGMPVRGGGEIKQGVFYRSDALASLTPAGVAALQASPISTVVDFRLPAESASQADRLPEDGSIRFVPLVVAQGAFAVPVSGGIVDLAVLLANLPPLEQLYIAMLQSSAATFAALARLVADGERVLFHCTAGKDRTGVSAAVVLDAAGADRSAIENDYVLSEKNLAGAWTEQMTARLAAMGVPDSPQIRSLVSTTPRAAIQGALAWVDDHYGSSATYLASGGLTDAELRALRDALVA